MNRGKTSWTTIGGVGRGSRDMEPSGRDTTRNGETGQGAAKQFFFLSSRLICHVALMCGGDGQTVGVGGRGSRAEGRGSRGTSTHAHTHTHGAHAGVGPHLKSAIGLDPMGIGLDGWIDLDQGGLGLQPRTGFVTGTSVDQLVFTHPVPHRAHRAHPMRTAPALASCSSSCRTFCPTRLALRTTADLLPCLDTDRTPARPNTQVHPAGPLGPPACQLRQDGQPASLCPNAKLTRCMSSSWAPPLAHARDSA